MGAPADNISTAAAAATSIADILRSNGVQDIYLYGPRVRGDDTPASNWDFILDFSRPVSKREFFTITQGLTKAIRDLDGETAGTYFTSPQYDRPSFTKYAVKSSALIFRAS